MTALRAVFLSFVTLDLLTNIAAVPLMQGLSDPALQPKFEEYVPNALHPEFKLTAQNGTDDTYYIEMGYSEDHETGLVINGTRLKTKIFGYGQAGVYTWPGKTIEVKSSRAGGPSQIKVKWTNNLRRGHILPVDTTLHWAFSSGGYSNHTIGIPVAPHLHGGHSDFQYDGHPESFWTPDGSVVGPLWDLVEGGFTDEFRYENSVEAKTLWYHDHTLGITRLNVYAGLAGFYFIRDDVDTGDEQNLLGVPHGEYELAYVIQDRMFTESGDLFFPASPGDPAYDDYIVGMSGMPASHGSREIGVELPTDKFPGGGPTVLAEFFGDHMVVNGKIWPRANVKPREYRIHFLNGCDSRYLVIKFLVVESGSTNLTAGTPLDFTVIGSDAGLGHTLVFGEQLVVEPGGRYVIVVDFGKAPGMRVILQNLAGDTPFLGAFGDDLASEDVFEDRHTDKIMAWDVELTDDNLPQQTLNVTKFGNNLLNDSNIVGMFPSRKVALIDGTDEFGRMLHLLGSATDEGGDPRGKYAGYSFFQETTEKPVLGSIEDWYILNFSVIAHPIHLHLVKFKIVGEFVFTFTVDGEQEIQQHTGGIGSAPRITEVSEFELIDASPYYYVSSYKDTVTVLPGNPGKGEGRGIIIRATFDKVGIYVWHCHILSHEDHEMMRVFEVVANSTGDEGGDCVDIGGDSASVNDGGDDTMEQDGETPKKSSAIAQLNRVCLSISVFLCTSLVLGQCFF